MKTPKYRFQTLDMARGAAVLLMVAFHFCYNLEYFGLVEINIKEAAFWISFRGFIVSSFVFIAGISLYLSSTKRTDFGSHLKKQKWLAICALLVSLATYPIFPESWIYFGVLHFILTARILCFALTGFFYSNLILGLGFIWAGMTIENELFNPKWINWLGFTTHKPFTEDYVPLFPWLGVFVLGMFLGRFLLSQPGRPELKNKHYSGCAAGILTLSGQNSLLIYIVHQPLLMGMIYIFISVFA